MNDERVQSALEMWFEDTDPQPPDARQTAAQVMADVPQTRQRGRWLPFPLFRHRVQTPTATDTIEYQSSPTPATDGHTPTVIGRTQTMFSPVKAITAGAIVFVLGGVMLIAQPSDRQAGSVPGAASDSDIREVVEAVTGTVTELGGDADSEGVAHNEQEGVRVVEGIRFTNEWQASDPRLSGTATYTATWREFLDRPGQHVEASSRVLVNDSGRWVGHGTGVELWSAGLANSEAVILRGEGAYEGLTAYVVMDWTTTGATFEALIFPGDLPSPPEPGVGE